MDFNQNKPIYLQIVDNISERILAGELLPEDRIQSVRDLGSDLGVNPNTVMRSYEKLTADGIIYNKRGIGYYVSTDAREIVLQKMREEFLNAELPQFIKRAKMLEIDLSQLFTKYTETKTSRRKKPSGSSVYDILYFRILPNAYRPFLQVPDAEQMP
jgi:DNA-binding transcriptional regulator YhcF (GntR family)